MAHFSSPHHPSGVMCVIICVYVWCFYQFSSLVPSFKLNEVHRSSAVGHALIYPIFIHRILSFLGLADFPSSEPVHVVGPLGATFLRQKAAHLRDDPSVSRGASSRSVPPPSSSTGAAETSGAAAVTDVPPPTTSDDSDIRRTLDHILTV